MNAGVLLQRTPYHVVCEQPRARQVDSVPSVRVPCLSTECRHTCMCVFVCVCCVVCGGNEHEILLQKRKCLNSVSAAARSSNGSVQRSATT